jgi:hypothetical protein
VNRNAVHFVAESLGLVLIGTGLWWLAPWAALVAVGGIVLAASVAGRVR